MNTHKIINTDINVRRGSPYSVNSKFALREYPDILDINQMSLILGVSTKTGYALLQSGKIAYLKVGRSYRIPKVKLLDYINSANLCK